MKLSQSTLFAGLLGVTLAASAAIADHTIESIAPEKTVVILGAKDAARSTERAKRTSLWNIWQSETMREYREAFMEQMTAGLDELYEELDVEKGSLTAPSGPAGMALYVFTDAELGTSHLGALGVADYGDDADKTHDLIKAALKRGAEDDGLKYEEDELLGNPMYVLLLPEKQQDEDEFRGGMGGMPFAAPEFRKVFGDLKSVYLVRCENAFLFGTEKSALRSAIERIEGEADPVLTDRDDFRAAMGMIGNEPDGYGLLLTRNFNDLLLAMGPEMGMGVSMVSPSFRAAFGKIGAIGGGIRVDGATAMIEQSMAIYLPDGKTGLFHLLDVDSSIEDVPTFVSPDAVSFGRMNFNFSELPRIARNIANNTPMLQMQGPEVVDQVIAMIEQFTAPLGNQIYFAQAMSRPITADSVGMFVAVECKNPQDFQTAMSQNGQGMQPRDFLGHTIYSSGGGMGAPEMNIGVGGRTLFIGPPNSVEAALRSIGSDDLPTLAASDSFQRGVSTLGSDRVVGWGYSDTVASMEAAHKQQRIQQQKMIDDIRDFDPAFADQMEQEMKEGEDPLEKIGFDFLREHLGPTVWQMRSVDKGFVFRSYLLDSGRQTAAVAE